MSDADPSEPGGQHTLLIGAGVVGAGAVIGLIISALADGSAGGLALMAGAGAGVVVAAVVLGLRVLRAL